jgi:hypothetical protein
LCFTKGEGSTPKSGLGRGRQTAVSSKTNTIKLVFFWFLELRVMFPSEEHMHSKTVPYLLFQRWNIRHFNKKFAHFKFFMTLNIPHIEQHFKCAFKTTSDLKLDHVEVKVCAYVFQEDFDSRLVVLLLQHIIYWISIVICSLL